MLKSPILLIALSCLFSINLHGQSADSDSLLIEKYKHHLSTLDYISRQTDNSKYFLNLATTYTDSILAIDPSNDFAKDFKNKINLTLATCEQNLNHRVELFPFFNGVPNYMGFTDEPIEYAYDNAFEKLLLYEPISQTNITSIIVRDNCDDEMFEIVNQILIKNTNHYILPFYEIEEIVGKAEALNIINGHLNDTNLSRLCDQLKIDRLGIFRVNDIDVIDNYIWLVDSKFNTFIKSEGFTEPIVARGFSLNKRNISLLAIFLHLLESILIISLISFFDQRKKLIKIYRDKTTSTVKSYLELFINKVRFISNCFAIPFVLSFIMIYSISVLMPNPEDHYMEATSILWIVSLTIVMSIIPTLLNLLYINRLDLDGFHSIKGYQYFFNTSLYASYFPVFIFFTIQFEYIPRFEHLLLVLITLVIANLLARSYYQFTAKSIHKNLKTLSIFGLVLGILSLVIFNTLLLSEINIQNLFYGFLIVVPIGFIHYLIGKRLEVINEKKLKESENVTLIEDIFIRKVINPLAMIYNKINNGMSTDKLNIMILSAPMGIGKTASLNEVKSEFEKTGWNWYYGDCDEIQGEGAVSFEPFIEAFSRLLKVAEFSNRHEGIETQKSIITSAANIAGVNTDFIADFQREEQKPMTEICIDIIDKLESLEKKTVFVMEDLHWIDPESYAFLKHFIEIINNNKFLRGNLCIILTLRDGLNTNYRGLAHQALIDDLEAINDDSDNKFLIEELLSTKDFNLFDFVKHLSNQNNKFKIQSYSMNQINTIFNDKLNENNDVAVLTPLYILKVIEGWIDDETLKYTPDGYLLTKNININDLPNSKEVDGYYHSIFKLFEPKWQRLLESAAIIGNKFDAEILAKVWGYELLDILAFLETAVKNKLLIDLADEDNMYQFTDKRIITAIKSHFIASDHMGSDKQIVIEYNKRYILLQQDIIENPSLYSVEDLLKVSRRLATLIANEKYQKQLHNLILEITIRFITSKDFNKLQAFSKFLESKKMYNISFIINILSIVSDEDTSYAKAKENIRKIHAYDNKPENIASLKITPKNEFEKELILISCLYYNSARINKEEFLFLDKKIKEKYKEHVLFEISLLLYEDTYEFRWEKFQGFEDILNSLKESKDYNLYNNTIEIKKLEEKRKFIQSKVNNSWSEKYPEPVLADIKNEYDFLYKKLIEFNNLKLLNIFLISYISFLSNELGKEKDAIDVYLKNIILFEDNNKYIREEIGLKMLVLSLFCRTRFIKNHKEKAKEDFNTINSYFQKRFRRNTFNRFIIEYLECKIQYLKEIKNFKEMKKVSKYVLDLTADNVGEKKHAYAHACVDYADTLSLNGEGKESLKWYEKRMSIQKILLDESDYTILKTAYHNLAIDYIDFEPENHKKIILYAKTALDLADPMKPNYWNTLWGYANALAHIGKYQESYAYCQKSIEHLKNTDTDEKEYISDLKLLSAIIYSNIDIKKSIPMLENALKKAFVPSELLSQKRIEKAKDILNKNKK